MHRTDLLRKLEAYAPLDNGDRSQLERFQAFVRARPDCFERSLAVGHVTASSWILDPSRSNVLLVHHKKLNKWLQPGGHADGDPDTLRTALREAREESGIESLTSLDDGIFDLDIHPIPATVRQAAHLHYDARYLLQAAALEFVVSEESHALAWVEILRLEEYTREDSIMRMREKWLNLQRNY